MGAFRDYLALVVLELAAEKIADLQDQLSNWSYLHLSFMEREPTKEELEALMGIELQDRNRPHILQRLYSRWQKCQREEHHKELGI